MSYPYLDHGFKIGKQDFWPPRTRLRVFTCAGGVCYAQPATAG